MSKLKLFLIITTLLLLFELSAQTRFYASGASSTSTDQSYKVVFTLENSSGQNFKAPSFKGFKILSGPNQSSSYQWINGKTQQSISIYYYLQALEPGTLTIEAAQIQVDNQILKTEAIQVQVKAGTTQTTSNTNNNNSKQNQSNNNTQSNSNANPTNGDWQKQAKDNLFVKVYTDKSKPYVGEQVYLYAKLYQRINTYGAQITAMPEFKGFWKQEVEINPNDWRDETIDGLSYKTLVIGKFALFPQREGKFNFAPIELLAALMISEPTLKNFGPFQMQTMGYKQVEYAFKSNPIYIEVQALPEEGKPLNFTGAVGKFKLSASIDSSEINLGEALTLKTKISGTGNIMAIGEPKIEFPKGFEIYDPQSEESISKKSEYLNGSKSFDYLMVAENSGSFTIPPISFSYFDLESKSYKTLESEKFNIRVKGEMPKSNQVTADQNLIDELDQDLRYIATKNDLSKEENSFFNSWSFYFLSLAPALLFGSLFLLLKFKESEVIDLAALKNKRASKEAQKRLKKAKTLLDEGNKAGFYNEIFEALNAYASDKFNISQADLNKELIIEKFKEKSVSETLANQFQSVLQNAEFALFGPSTYSKMNEDFEIITKCIIDIENELS